MKKCPFCAEEIQDEAVKCKHCGSSLDDGLDGRSPSGEPVQRPGRDTLDSANTLDEQQVLADRYRVIREIGHGGMGAVYLAHDSVLDIDVAVKLLPALLARDRRAMDNLKREARTSMRLSHPNIVRIYHFEDDPRATFLVMEYVEGRTLEDLLHAKGKLTLEELLPIAEQVAAGLDYAHDQGVLHRDVKPSNILLTAEGAAKIADFGIAREMKASQTRITGQQTSGTLLYMSPEQVMGEDLDARSDIYSLGAVLCECLSGKPPFTHGDITTQIREKRPSDLPDVPDHVNAAVQTALAKAAEDRPATAGALVERLREKPTPVLKPPPPRLVVELAPPILPSEPKREPPARQKPPEPIRREPPTPALKPGTRSRRTGKVLAGLIVVGILVTVIVIAARPGDDRPRIDPGMNENSPPDGRGPGPPADDGAAPPTDALAPAEAQRRAKLAQLLAKAKANDNRDGAKVALAALEELLRLDPAHSEASALRERVRRSLGPATLIVPDQYTKIQGAINAARSGDTVRVKAGVYEESLRFKDGIRLVGEGMDAVTIRCDAKRGFVVLARDCRSGLLTGVTLEHVGSDTDDRRYGGIALRRSSVEVFRCKVQRSAGHGIFIEGKGSPQIRECILVSNGWTGIYVTGQGANPGLTGNRCRTNGSRGIGIDEGAEGIAANNLCEDNARSGIFVGGKGTSPTLNGNICRENRGDGINFARGAAGIADGNTCEKNLGCGIKVSSASTIPYLRANRCTDNTRYGIYRQFGSQPHIDADNVVENNTRGQIEELRSPTEFYATRLKDSLGLSIAQVEKIKLLDRPFWQKMEEAGGDRESSRQAREWLQEELKKILTDEQRSKYEMGLARAGGRRPTSRTRRAPRDFASGWKDRLNLTRDQVDRIKALDPIRKKRMADARRDLNSLRSVRAWHEQEIRVLLTAEQRTIYDGYQARVKASLDLLMLTIRDDRVLRSIALTPEQTTKINAHRHVRDAAVDAAVSVFVRSMNRLLTPEQEKIFEDYLTEGRPSSVPWYPVDRALREVQLTSEQNALVSRLVQTRDGKIKAAYAAHMNSVKAVLTPQQQAQLEQNLKRGTTVRRGSDRTRARSD